MKRYFGLYCLFAFFMLYFLKIIYSPEKYVARFLLCCRNRQGNSTCVRADMQFDMSFRYIVYNIIKTKECLVWCLSLLSTVIIDCFACYNRVLQVSLYSLLYGHSISWSWLNRFKLRPNVLLWGPNYDTFAGRGWP